ncbi:hypothetical protein ACOT81_22870 [Streptomyces sp. WI04-05B]|uniref:hypothetical protein n=1 Tax=Streptomyces TaxID=1883 RepID=UPI0029A265D9|nr:MULTISPECIES: hypothetical protein [unclassified Streptomyces]MDX2543090.1 hypothetical protein [Streptomyces sp. WI04-05B]MDX2584869.1 hypothetical protein [Streptomyces sp. WI04-05A]
MAASFEGFGPVVVPLDLRSGAAALDTPQALRARVARRLAQAGQPEPDDPMFLVTDTPAGLTDHQRQYELLAAHRAVGEVRILVLLVGSAPGSYAGAGEAFRPDRRLLRPAVLRTDRAAVLWAGDLRSSRTALENPAPDDPDALAVLVDVLSVPDIYRRVLKDVAALPDAVAAPGVRLLEQDLPPETRDRAWRDALTRFAGHDTDHAPPTAAGSGADLPDPLRALANGRSGRDQRHRQPNGTAEDTYRACADALDYADEALAGLRTLPGLLRPSRRSAFEADLDQAHRSLDAYRSLVGRALRSGTGTTSSTAEAAARLTDLGLRVPTTEGMRDRIGDGLREYAEKLLAQGLPLRSVAQRFTTLAGRVEPVPSSALARKLAEFNSPPEGARGTARPATTNEHPTPDSTPPGARGTARPATTDPHPAYDVAPGAPAATFTAALLGALWQAPLQPLALLIPLLFIAMAQLGTSRLHGSGRPGHWALAPRIAAFGGALTGTLLAYATHPAPWLSTSGLLLGLCAAAETARRLWRTAADTWAPGHATAALRQSLAGLDALLAQGVREHWAVEERLNCADAARSVAGVLRATAAAAEAEAVPEPERTTVGGGNGMHGTYGAPGSAADDWLSSTPDAFSGAGDGTADGTDEKDGHDDWMSAYAWPDAPPWDHDPAHPTDATNPADAAADPDEPLVSPVSPSARTPHPAPPDSPDSPTANGAGGTPRWLDRETGEGGPELVATLAADLTDAALEAMRSYWGAVERGQAGTLAATRIEGRVAELLSTARRHLRHNGVLAPPPFAAPRRARATSANLLGTDPQGLAELVGAETGRQAVVQLSSPDQSTLLSRDPAAAVWIRFAPLAVRDEVEKAWRANGSDRSQEVEWTSSGRYAGLLRLTPLRPGVVETFRPRDDGDSDGHDGMDDSPYDRPYDGSYDRADGDRW